ncbi:16S rRNA (guanine(966)-N(2))-methyltransferase [hydrothermal vent metagenome]|uniref:16S rRNA (Guanine(966)-N(2))-methyltransferase n=1 Tax=hydrothermal vent metagenome TaxID=652676 RepID=A0A3B0YL29_9ZZZZ
MKSTSNQVRIIAGRWRGSRLVFPDAEGLRPTSDRIRETLFNWVAGLIPGARCLDMFAGSGALGFEAASRGAEKVVLLEHNPLIVAALQNSRDRIDDGVIEIHATDAKTWVRRCDDSFDLVFLDPPFSDYGLLADSVSALVKSRCVKPGGRIYFELSRQVSLPDLPEDWVQEKAKIAGQVGYYLFRRSGNLASASDSD